MFTLRVCVVSVSSSRGTACRARVPGGEHLLCVCFSTALQSGNFSVVTCSLLYRLL